MTSVVVRKAVIAIAVVMGPATARADECTENLDTCVAIATCTDPTTADERRALFHDTAVRVYRLSQTAQA